MDALIPREDFEVKGNTDSHNLFDKLAISQLTSPTLQPFLRKPDFQRETNEWDVTKIVSFLDSFLNGELIPSIILWRNNAGYYFVIDGAHRLSALLAWVYDDYGDGQVSSKFYQNNITDEQKELADKARKKINKEIGSYQHIIESIGGDNLGYIQKAKNLGAYSVDVQWVSGDASKAEKSFFKINQQASKIAPTELKLLKSRKHPNCIAARAIIRGGEGHKYWSEFSAENQDTIQTLSKEINGLLFTPPYKSPVKTIDLPIAGKQLAASTLPLILEFVNTANKIPNDFEDTGTADKTGEVTIQYLKNVRKLVWRINSIHASSLGLHPAIYFYSNEGKHKPASFHYTVSFIQLLLRKDLLKLFTENRREFEQFLLKYDFVIAQIWRKYRQTSKALPHVTDFYALVLNKLAESSSGLDNVVKDISSEKHYEYLNMSTTAGSSDNTQSRFNSETKSAVFMREAIENCITCKICGGYIHKHSITIDHIERKQDGGKGSVENGQIAHPYCNTTYKN